MLVKLLMDQYKVSTRQVCEAMMLNRSVWYYKSVRRSDVAVRRCIVEIANTRIRYGVNRIHAFLSASAGRTIRSKFIVFTRKKDLIFDVNGPVEAKVAARHMERPNLIKPH